MTFSEYCYKKDVAEFLSKSNISLKIEQDLYEQSLIMLEEGLLDSVKSTLKTTGKYLRKAIDIPENITAGIHKAYKVMKSTAFLAALIYMGFRFEVIRALFPWLAPIVDSMGSMVLSAGKDFLLGSFNWLSKIAKDVVVWLVEVVKEDLLKGSTPMPETPGGPSIFDPGFGLPDRLRRLGHQGA